MTAFVATAPPEPRLGRVVAFLAGMALLAFSITLLWLSMRIVMGIGGACASGGPYVPAVECPDAVVALTPLSIFGGILGVGLAAFGAAGIGGAWLSLIFLAWPALFLSLGWNFLEFGLRPPGADPGELEWGWLFCAVVFGLMGGVPLVGAIWALRQADESPSSLRTRRVLSTPRGRYQVSLVDRRPASAGGRAEGDVASRLERLARLHDGGDLTDAEFDAAKRATLDEAGA